METSDKVCEAYVFAGGQIHTVELETNEDIPISDGVPDDLTSKASRQEPSNWRWEAGRCSGEGGQQPSQGDRSPCTSGQVAVAGNQPGCRRRMDQGLEIGPPSPPGQLLEVLDPEHSLPPRCQPSPQILQLGAISHQALVSSSTPISISTYN